MCSSLNFRSWCLHTDYPENVMKICSHYQFRDYPPMFPEQRYKHKAYYTRQSFQIGANTVWISGINKIWCLVRIYGDKAPDIVDGLKKTPAVAVPLVLKRWGHFFRVLWTRWKMCIDKNLRPRKERADLLLKTFHMSTRCG